MKRLIVLLCLLGSSLARLDLFIHPYSAEAVGLFANSTEPLQYIIFRGSTKQGPGLRREDFTASQMFPLSSVNFEFFPIPLVNGQTLNWYLSYKPLVLYEPVQNTEIMNYTREDGQVSIQSSTASQGPVLTSSTASQGPVLTSSTASQGPSSTASQGPVLTSTGTQSQSTASHGPHGSTGSTTGHAMGLLLGNFSFAECVPSSSCCCPKRGTGLRVSPGSSESTLHVNGEFDGGDVCYGMTTFEVEFKKTSSQEASLTVGDARFFLTWRDSYRQIDMRANVHGKESCTLHAGRVTSLVETADHQPVVSGAENNMAKFAALLSLLPILFV